MLSKHENWGKRSAELSDCLRVVNIVQRWKSKKKVKRKMNKFELYFLESSSQIIFRSALRFSVKSSKAKSSEHAEEEKERLQRRE